ncbi:biotin--[acetyl-CoA-carboxylase] ligase [Sinimarinibacterium thermocellulolyticum]|uniref:Bifunctional ligase/repressor BirA n=1 Tax=Sinimarinibacterium thermocellulolyticum TaxID=3170016 RepID=A0ABV2AC40_9GAMM
MAQSLSEAELLALVDRLADGDWHSGERLAAACGISRAALAKRIERLKDWQLAVEARHGLGYRLAAPIERLDAARLQAALGERLRVRVVAVTDSTNAQLLAADANDDPQALFAEYQTAGRGRRGRGWVTPFAAQLAFSVAWSFDAVPAQLSALPLAVGVVLARRLHALGAAAVRVKWPNDLVADGRKLAGILIEHRGEGGGCRVIVGVGLNLGLRPEHASEVTQPWINLTELLAAPVARNALAADLLDALTTTLAAYPRTGFAGHAAHWPALDVSYERPVQVQLGERRIDGIARGVDDDGALLVDAAGTRHRLHSGEVSLRLAR